MDIKDVIYSEELSVIIRLAEKDAKKKNLAQVSLESVQYNLLMIYLAGNGTGRNLDAMIKKKMKDQDKEQFLVQLEESVAKAEKYLEKRTYTDDEEPEFSDSLNRVIERVDVTLDIVKGAASSLGIGSKGKVIDTETFYTAMFFERTGINNLLIKREMDNAALLEELTNTATSGMEEDMKEEKMGEDLPEDKKSGDSEEENFDRAGKQRDEIRVRKPKKNSTTPTIDEFSTDMTELAEEGRYDPLVGRDKEIELMIEILSCRKKRNVMLLGDAGCGKTAIVEGLSQRIVAGNVPATLKGKRIVNISTADLTAGTQYRGQLEERVMNLCQELKQHPEILCYIDEIHQATSDSSSSSIAELLKPFLGRGEITVIASTTLDEYKKYIEKDAALKRRFQKVMVLEPDQEETYRILKGLSKKYGEFHHVRYTDEALKAAAEWSGRYLYDRKKPDSAIDLLDGAGAYVKLENPSDTKELDRLEKEKSEATKKKIKAIDKSDFSLAKEQRDEEDRLDKEIADLKKKLASVDPKTWPEVGIEAIAAVVSKISGVDVDKIISPEMEKIRAMKDDLKKIVIGQDEAIDSVVKVLSKSFLGLRNENKPIASLLFVGPSGTGKTLIATKIAETIYGDKSAMLKINCGELREAHSVTKLIGAPPSYVGYQDSALLDKVRDRPQQVVIFDEIEKASQDIIGTVFLNIMDEGVLTLQNGKVVSFKDTIIIFSSNQGQKDLELKGNGIGFGDRSAAAKEVSDKATIMKSLEKLFRPEWRGRLSSVTIFNHLGEPELMKIFDLELAKFKERLKKRGYSLTVGKDLKKFIVSKVDSRYGARDLIKGISTYIEDRIVEKMLDTSVDLTKKKIKANLVGEEVEITFE